MGLNSGALRVFTEVLFTTGKQLCDRLKSHSIAPNQLEDVRWLLNVEVANSSATRVNRPSCNLELLLSNSVTKQTDKVPIQLSHEGLSKLFQSIEEVQLQLDKL